MKKRQKYAFFMPFAYYLSIKVLKNSFFSQKALKTLFPSVSGFPDRICNYEMRETTRKKKGVLQSRSFRAFRVFRS